MTDNNVSVRLQTPENNGSLHLVSHLHELLTVAFQESAAPRMASTIRGLQRLPALVKWKPARIAIKAKGRILLLNPAEISAIEARGNYVLLQRTSTSHILRESISTLEERLSLRGFVRIHRSVLVNAALVEEVQPWSTGQYVLRMKGGKQYIVTRSYKKNLQLLAHLWIGTEGFDS